MARFEGAWDDTCLRKREELLAYVARKGRRAVIYRHIAYKNDGVAEEDTWREPGRAESIISCPACFFPQPSHPIELVFLARQRHGPDMASSSVRARSLYRSLLRELPQRPLSAPSLVQQRIRNTIATQPHGSAQLEMDQADQYVQYTKAQRMYTTLLERYNPGMEMDEEERVRLTARRVGMDLPDDFIRKNKA
ncbi:MAG: hypothetical protein Q9205_004744 [Flavoplaca limonia]